MWDYKGRLMDGETVIENDVLNVFHYTDVMSEEGFQHLLTRHYNKERMESRRRYEGPLVARSDIPAEPLSDERILNPDGNFVFLI
ncbi:hypothetical protein TNCV_1801981 [Trichonephila clavipes]|nr:hypothetical protein TNCV_1801981 [Trichonephila clavipes]